MWLAPNEKFLPGNVKTFLANVHAEREKPSSQKIKDIGDNLSHYYEDLVYYDGNDSRSATQNNRKRRNFDKDTSLEYIFELPIDDASENWFLVTNEELGTDKQIFKFILSVKNLILFYRFTHEKRVIFHLWRRSKHSPSLWSSQYVFIR